MKVALALFLMALGATATHASKSLVRVATKVSDDPNPDDYLPMPPYRCIRQGSGIAATHVFTSVDHEDDIRNMLLEIHGEQKLRDTPECGVIDPAWCKEEGKLYPIPCKSGWFVTMDILKHRCASSLELEGGHKIFC